MSDLYRYYKNCSYKLHKFLKFIVDMAGKMIIFFTIKILKNLYLCAKFFIPTKIKRLFIINQTKVGIDFFLLKEKNHSHIDTQKLLRTTKKFAVILTLVSKFFSTSYSIIKAIIPMKARFWIVAKLKKLGIDIHLLRDKISFRNNMHKPKSIIQGNKHADNSIAIEICKFLYDTTNRKISDDISYNHEDYFNLKNIIANIKSSSDLQARQKICDFKNKVKLIAFYLPQYHPIPENDLWWGKGFTEWTNVAKARPNFIGHYQPKLPADFGFYDLRVDDVMKHQAELAKKFGIHGFCYYYYWFNGKKLLEMPLERLLVKNIPDFPFCLCWANETWSRRWDGSESDILVAQNHTHEDDINVIKDLVRYFKHPNYIKVDNRPILLIYRIELFADITKTVDLWRNYCVNEDVGDPYLVYVQSFQQSLMMDDPKKFGFDAAMEFPPHGCLVPPEKSLEVINSNFNGTIFNYEKIVEHYIQKKSPKYPWFRGIMPSWDNTARKQNNPHIFTKASPGAYRAWLEEIAKETVQNNYTPEKIIFINAWNEWGEGAYLEPDGKYGYAYLQATHDALMDDIPKNRKIIYVSHDALLFGAQRLTLSIIKLLKEKFHYDVHLILKSGGELEDEYEKYSTVYNIDTNYKTRVEQNKLIDYLCNNLEIKNAICNTVVSGDFAELLNKKDIRVITLVHELPGMIESMSLEDKAYLLANNSYKVIFPSNFVKEKFKTIVDINDEKTIVLPQGSAKHCRYKYNKMEAKTLLRKTLNVNKESKIVLNVGYGDKRKGFDLFVEIANKADKQSENIYFVWVGNLHPEFSKIKLSPPSKNLILIDNKDDVSIYFAGSNLFLLTSREDPFPSVVLEAMNNGLPVIGFDNAGGFKDIIDETTGVLVDFCDIEAMFQSIIALIHDKDRINKLGNNAAKLVEEKFNFASYIYSLLDLLGHHYEKISVIIPNYNYEKYLPKRIQTVLEQTYPIYEIIFLDDASEDGSVSVIKSYLCDELNIKLLNNINNSGNVFKQWFKGIKAANGSYIWIAEADDLSENTFLEKLMQIYDKDNSVVLAYSQSKQMNSSDEVVAENYLEYTSDIDKSKWKTEYLNDGLTEVSDILAVKNTIPNVSAVVFKKVKTDYISMFYNIFQYKIAGDWCFYISILKFGKIGFTPEPLNTHRRHSQSVTTSGDSLSHYNEVVSMQNYVINNFNVSKNTVAKIYAYREHLKKYFNLS